MQTGEELTPEENPHCNKDCKDSEDLEDLKEHHEQEMTSRALEESQRQEGLAGFEFDFKRISGNLGATRPNKTDGKGLGDQREALKRQVELLAAKKKM